MYYVFDISKVNGEFVAPVVVIFNENGDEEAKVFASFSKHSNFDTRHNGAGMVPLPPTNIGTAYMRYVVVNFKGNGNVYLTDATAPGFMLDSMKYDKLPKKYAVPWGVK